MLFYTLINTPLFLMYIFSIFLFYLIWYHFIDWMVEKAGGEWDIGKCYDIS